LFCLVALLLAAGSSLAAQDPGWYLGAGFGWSKADINADRLTHGLPALGYGGTSFTLSDKDTAYKAFLGYSFNRYLALEAGYFNLGSYSYHGVAPAPGTLAGNFKVDGPSLDAVLRLPFTESFAFFLRAGAAYVEVRDHFEGTALLPDTVTRPRTRETNLKYGGGFQFDLCPTMALRAEVERYRISDPILKRSNLDVASLSFLVRLGPRASMPIPSAYVPPPAPQAPAPPILITVPVAVETQQYCTILDIQFEVDADDIQREEKEKLAVLGTFMTKYPATTALIEGHTDNVGTVEHNADLSLKRAESVVAYLVGTLNLDSSRLKAVGYGSTRPIADNATDEGKRMNRRIDAVIACVTDVEGLVVKPARMTMALAIEFDQNKADVKSEYDDSLTKVARFLKANPAVTATVEGHTGNLQGTPALAMEISRRRAQNVVDYLVFHLGIDPARLSAEGFGKSRPFAYNTSLDGAQENRRVNIIINYPRTRN
jgi:OOP family OmpA-OmpF porin